MKNFYFLVQLFFVLAPFSFSSTSRLIAFSFLSSTTSTITTTTGTIVHNRVGRSGSKSIIISHQHKKHNFVSSSKNNEDNNNRVENNSTRKDGDIGNEKKNSNEENSKMSTSTKVSKVASSVVAQKSIGKLHPESTALLVCDIQERFRSVMYKSETVISTARYMTSIAKALNMPIITTQQYTKVFGPTVPDVFENGIDDINNSDVTSIFEKKLFSMLTSEVKDHLQPLNKKSYILVGIEAHVCVQQTALDLLEKGNDVHIIVDGVSSQQAMDREIALQRMMQAGAYLTTAQSAAFMLMQSADHPNFKTISKLTVNHMKLPNEFNGDSPSRL